MLVQCPNCSVHYDHARGACVACGTVYEPTDEQRRAECLQFALAVMERGARRGDVVAVLLARGELPEREVAAIADEAAETMRRQSRMHGAQLAGSGFALLFVAAVAFVLSAGIVIASGCLIVGGGMAILGTLKLLTGWNITGNDDPLPATEYDPRHH